MFTRTLIAAAMTVAPALAYAEIKVMDGYARSSNPRSGAAFMVIMNSGDTADRLIAAKSDVSKRVELHTHRMENDVMKMVEIEDGIEIPAGGEVALARGGDHVMFMGVTDPIEPGETVKVTLVFEEAGEIEIEVPVDNDRKPAKGHGSGHGHGHSGHSHGSDG